MHPSCIRHFVREFVQHVQGGVGIVVPPCIDRMKVLFMVMGAMYMHQTCSLPVCSPSDDEGDCAGLLALYESTGQVIWNDTPVGLCSWPGVSCNAVGRAQGLDLHNLQLAGTLPSELGLLTEVVFLSTQTVNKG
jgi:hypothetical protein